MPHWIFHFDRNTITTPMMPNAAGKKKETGSSGGC
jgi:hypothetical protein